MMSYNEKQSLKGNRIYQYLAALSGTLGIISSEMHYGWPSPSLPILLSGSYKIHIETDEASWLAIMPILGGLLGSITSGFIIDIIGRKKIILFSAIPFVITWLMIGFAETSILLHVARFIAGMTDGLSMIVVLMFLGEIAEPKIRGMLSSMCPVAIVMGLLLMNVIGNYLSISSTAFVASIFPLVLLLIFIWIPESPYCLLMKGKVDEAKNSLKTFRGTEYVDNELERLEMAVKEQNANTRKFTDLFTSPSNRKAIIITLGLRGFQQLSGTIAINLYCKTILNEARDFISPEISTTIFYLVQLTLTATASILVDISGRRSLLIISIIGTAIALFINGGFLYVKNCTTIDITDFDYIPIVSMLLYIIFFSIGLQTIPLLFMSEMFPTNVKAFALCLTGIYFSLLASAISKFFHVANDTFGMHVPFLTFAVFCVIGLIFIIFFVPETKGKTLEDIQRYLKNEIKL